MNESPQAYGERLILSNEVGSTFAFEPGPVQSDRMNPNEQGRGWFRLNVVSLTEQRLLSIGSNVGKHLSPRWRGPDAISGKIGSNRNFRIAETSLAAPAHPQAQVRTSS
jgi:hypothetical protein